MRKDAFRRAAVLTLAALCMSPAALAQLPDHPIITEAYYDPPGDNDGPVGRDATNAHQEYLEIYLPPAGNLDPDLNKDFLRLTFYHVEGDWESVGRGLVNYRFDLPPFDLDPSNGISEGAIARPPSGVVVLGWVDYVGNPPTGLAGTPNSRVALIDGGVTEVSGFTFIAVNGHHFGGTTNFPILEAESLIDVPEETRNGFSQNGSAAYLLVDRDSPRYVELFDDMHVPDGRSADPELPTGWVLGTSALLDGFAGNDDRNFDVLEQPYDAPTGDEIDLEDVLPRGGAFSRLVCQVPERGRVRPSRGTANGFARVFIDVPRTTETGDRNDPVADALNAYRHIRNDGPFFPSPGWAALTGSPPRLSVASATEQRFEILTQTIGRPALLTANVGGNFGIDIAVSPGASSNPSVAAFSADEPDLNVAGQALGLPTVAIEAGPSAAHGQSAFADTTVSATNSSGDDPPVEDPVRMVEITATVLNPIRGLDENGQPFQTTVFIAVQGIPAGAENNEFLNTDLGRFVRDNLGGRAQETRGNGAALIDPSTDLSSSDVILPMIEEFPAEFFEYINAPGARLDLVQTVVRSAAHRTDDRTYADSINPDEDGLKAIRLNVPDTFTSGGTFSPTERIHFADARGFVADPRSGLSNATTSRTFELVLVDTNVRFFGNIETGATDDFGIIVEALDVEADSPILPGEFIFLSFSGGLQGEDIDTLQVPPGQDVIANLIYLDLDNLHEVLGVRSIELAYLVDAGSGGEVDIIEVFSLNPVVGGGTPGDLNCDGQVNAFDIEPFLLAMFNPGEYAIRFPGCDINNGDIDGDGTVNAFDIEPFLVLLFGP